VALAVVVALFGLGLAALRGRARARRSAADRRPAVLDVCDQMAAELRAGQPPGRALQHAAEAWSDLEPAAGAFALGGDVAAALRSAGQRPGAEALRTVAAAWEVAQRSGAGLAAVLDRTAEALRAEDATRREVTAALGPPRATARLLALLPVFGLLLGTGVGADPWGFLTGTPVGVACLAVGGGLGLAGLAWVERLAAAAERTP
jgi:tight adherence protein B